MGRFDFDSLPHEIAAVLRDVLNWRNARDLAQDSHAEMYLRDLEDSSAMFKTWCTAQGEAITRGQFEEMMNLDLTPPRMPPNTPIPQKRNPDRQARQERIAKSGMRLVPNEED